MEVAVIGLGGVGGYFGGKIARSSGQDQDTRIHFIARGRHLEEIQKNGLLVDSDEGAWTARPSSASDDIAGLPILDICLLCVKSYDLGKVLLELKDKIHGSTIILPLLNGVDIPDRIRAVIQNGIVLPSCVYVGTHIERPGMVKQRGGACTIHLGRDPENGVPVPELLDLLQRSGIKHYWTDDPRAEIWGKFLFIAAFGLVTARYGKTMGEVMASADLCRDVRNIMAEVLQISKKKGIALPPTIIEDSIKKGAGFPFAQKTSFQRDFEAIDKPDERDLFGGSVLRMGQELGVPTETTASLYAAIQSMKPLKSSF